MASTKPPREGARWGNDIQQVAPEVTETPPAYAKLCDEFGEPNVQRALQVREKIRIDYPHLFVMKLDPIEFAGGILRSARDSVQKAAEDGRPHTMPETLKIMEDILGNHFAANPTHGTTVNITYGDERRGRKGKKATSSFISLCGGVAAFVLALAIFRRLEWAVGAAVVAYGVAEIVQS